jgi:hypothetical protein
LVHCVRKKRERELVLQKQKASQGEVTKARVYSQKSNRNISLLANTVYSLKSNKNPHLPANTATMVLFRIRYCCSSKR